MSSRDEATEWIERPLGRYERVAGKLGMTPEKRTISWGLEHIVFSMRAADVEGRRG